MVCGIILISTLIANLHVAVWPFTFVLFLPYIAEYIIANVADIIIYRKYAIWINQIRIKLQKDTQKIKILKQKQEEIKSKNIRIEQKRKQTEPYKIQMNINKNGKWLILIMLVCGLTGLLTPLGSTPYTYLYKTMIGDTVNNINEHLPLTLIDNTPIMCAIVIVLAVMIFTKAKIKLSDLFMISGLCFLMFSSRRQSTMFVLIGSIILNKMIVQLLEIYYPYKKEEIEKKLINIVTIIIAIAIVGGLSINYFDKVKNDEFVDESTYPVEASKWILENLDVQNIRLFNEYNYGSYLMYRKIPVFIDSRADLYSPEFNGHENIFMDFIHTSNIGKYYGTIFKKYNITHVLLYKNSKISMLIDNADSEKYEKIYTDDHFVIYKVIEY